MMLTDEQKDLIRRLRGLANYTHIDCSIGNEAADMIEEMSEALRPAEQNAAGQENASCRPEHEGRDADTSQHDAVHPAPAAPDRPASWIYIPPLNQMAGAATTLIYKDAPDMPPEPEIFTFTTLNCMLFNLTTHDAFVGYKCFAAWKKYALAQRDRADELDAKRLMAEGVAETWKEYAAKAERDAARYRACMTHGFPVRLQTAHANGHAWIVAGKWTGVTAEDAIDRAMAGDEQNSEFRGNGKRSLTDSPGTTG